MKLTTLSEASVRYELNGECEFYCIGKCSFINGTRCIHSGVKEECGLYHIGKDVLTNNQMPNLFQQGGGCL